MNESVKRQYRSPVREESARRTRVQIREAASGLFIRQGYGTTTMRQIADQARVSERTAYLIFPSKLDLLLEVIGVATTGGDDPTPPATRRAFPPPPAEPDGKKALALGVKLTSTLLERAGPVVMAAYESVGLGEELREGALEGERARARDLSLIAKALKAHGALRSDVSVEEATDILLVMISPHAHQMLRRDRGRSLARYRSTLLKALEGALLAD